MIHTCNSMQDINLHSTLTTLIHRKCWWWRERRSLSPHCQYLHKQTHDHTVLVQTIINNSFLNYINTYQPCTIYYHTWLIIISLLKSGIHICIKMVAALDNNSNYCITTERAGWLHHDTYLSWKKNVENE